MFFIFNILFLFVLFIGIAIIYFGFNMFNNYLLNDIEPNNEVDNEPLLNFYKNPPINLPINSPINPPINTPINHPINPV
jgi:hypothetical protein